jgi:hypothetical protein
MAKQPVHTNAASPAPKDVCLLGELSGTIRFSEKLDTMESIQFQEHQRTNRHRNKAVCGEHNKRLL